MDSLIWAGFLLAILAILVLSRWHMGLSLMAASLILAVFTITPDMFGSLTAETFTDPDILLMALAVALIPMIGGYMEMSGLTDSLVENLRMSRRGFLGTMPALLGMLPMPGGALLSAPLIKRGGKGVPAASKAAINVWFRHVIYLVYPISTALIVSSYLAGLSMYAAIPILAPFFLALVALGYFFLLRGVKGSMPHTGEVSPRGLGVPLLILLAAPVIDFGLLRILQPGIRELSLVVGVGVSLALAAYFSGFGPGTAWRVARRTRPWNFGLIILGMFLFLAVFNVSGVSGLIAELGLPTLVLCVGVGFVLGLATGRIQVPASIIIPIYLGGAGVGVMPPWHFAAAYVSIFLGYVMSPVHPCASISLEYFGATLKDYLKTLAVPVGLMLCTLVTLWIFLF